MFLHVSVVYSFSFLRSFPLYDYTTMNLPILLLQDIWVVCSLETVLNNAVVSNIAHVLSVGYVLRSAVTGPQVVSECSALVGTAKWFPKVTAPVGIP